MPSIAELRTWLQTCERELQRLDMRLSRGRLPGSLLGLNTRLALISEILAAQRDGVALVSAEQQLLDLMLSASLARVRAAIAAQAPPSLPIVAPELPLD